MRVPKARPSKAGFFPLISQLDLVVFISKSKSYNEAIGVHQGRCGFNWPGHDCKCHERPSTGKSPQTQTSLTLFAGLGQFIYFV